MITARRMIFVLKYNDFKNTIINKIKDYLPLEYKNYTLKVQKINKVNQTLEGICLFDESKKVSAAPVIYVEMLYDFYCKNGSIAEVLKTAAAMISDSNKYIKPDFIADENLIKDNVVMVVINADSNKELLSNIPYVEFIDLAVVFRWIVSKEDNCYSGAIITNDMAENFSLSKEELFELAKVNTKRIFPVMFQPLSKVISRLNPPEEIIKSMNNCPLYILSNSIGTEGACGILYDDVLKDIKAVLKDDFYIMPSSVNEVLVLSRTGYDVDFVKEMVKFVNETVVNKEEWLSDSVYLYDGEVKMI